MTHVHFRRRVHKGCTACPVQHWYDQNARFHVYLMWFYKDITLNMIVTYVVLYYQNGRGSNVKVRDVVDDEVALLGRSCPGVALLGGLASLMLPRVVLMYFAYWLSQCLLELSFLLHAHYRTHWPEGLCWVCDRHLLSGWVWSWLALLVRWGVSRLRKMSLFSPFLTVNGPVARRQREWGWPETVSTFNSIHLICYVSC